MIQLTWPHAATDWAYCLDEITATFLDLAEAITRYERLLVVTPDIAGTYQQLAQRLSVEALRQTTLFECPTNDTWARDHGALTLLANDSSQELLDFQFNGWGEKFPADLDNAINRRLADANLLGAPLSDHNDFVLEGGSVETDGCGTVFTTAQCLLAPHRNQPLTLEGIETQLKERLHAQRIVWLHHGHLVGDDTDGHIDTIVRCAPNDTLLYIACSDTADEQYTDFKALEAELQTLRNDNGTPYRLLSLPMPNASSSTERSSCRPTASPTTTPRLPTPSDKPTPTATSCASMPPPSSGSTVPSTASPCNTIKAKAHYTYKNKNKNYKT